MEETTQGYKQVQSKSMELIKDNEQFKNTQGGQQPQTYWLQ